MLYFSASVFRSLRKCIHTQETSPRKEEEEETQSKEHRVLEKNFRDSFARLELTRLNLTYEKAKYITDLVINVMNTLQDEIQKQHIQTTFNERFRRAYILLDRHKNIKIQEEKCKNAYILQHGNDVILGKENEKQDQEMIGEEDITIKKSQVEDVEQAVENDPVKEVADQVENAVQVFKHKLGCEEEEQTAKRRRTLRNKHVIFSVTEEEEIHTSVFQSQTIEERIGTMIRTSFINRALHTRICTSVHNMQEKRKSPVQCDSLTLPSYKRIKRNNL
jgi:hypothetical protein